MTEPNILIEHREVKERPLSVELTRGANGVYRWTIKAYGEHYASIMDDLTKADKALRKLFGQPEVEG